MSRSSIAIVSAIFCFIAAKMVVVYTGIPATECLFGVCKEILAYGIA